MKTILSIRRPPSEEKHNHDEFNQLEQVTIESICAGGNDGQVADEIIKRSDN